MTDTTRKRNARQGTPITSRAPASPLFSRQVLFVLVGGSMAATCATLCFVLGMSVVTMLPAACTMIVGLLTLLLGQLARRRFRVSLRVALLGMAVLCGLFAIGGKQLADSWAEKRAVNSLLQKGATASYAFLHRDASDDYVTVKSGLRCPGWLVDMLGEPYFDDLRSLNLVTSRVTDDDLQLLENVHHLSELDLQASPITAAGLARLPEIAGLQTLKLNWNQISPESVARLRRMHDLRELIISEPVGDEPTPFHLLTGLDQITRLVALTHTFSRQDAVTLASLENLQELSLGYGGRRMPPKVETTGAVEALAQSISLSRVIVNAVLLPDLSDDNYEALVAMPSLSFLSIGCSPATPRPVSLEKQNECLQKYGKQLRIWP